MYCWQLWVHMSGILWLWEKIRAQAAGNDLGYKTEKYGKSQGLDYEQLGETTLCNTDWKTVVYVNLGQNDCDIEQLS